MRSELVPGLTTMGLPHDEMGHWAVERLLASDGAGPPIQHELPCALIERGSVGPPRG